MNRIKTTATVTALLLAGHLSHAIGATIPDPLPDPDGKPADMSKPVEVYILLGQSNMLGFGKITGAPKGVWISPARRKGFIRI